MTECFPHFHRTRSRAGGFIFAENPSRPTCDACLVWSAAVDPAVVRAEAYPAGHDDAGVFDIERLGHLARIALAPDGTEYLVLTDGIEHLRLDIGAGTLRAGPVRLEYRLSGLIALAPAIATLRRLRRLYRCGVFSGVSSARAQTNARQAMALRVYDGLRAGASHRDIATVLYGDDRVDAEWRSETDSLKSRIRRLAKLANRLADGGYRALLG